MTALPDPLDRKQHVDLERHDVEPWLRWAVLETSGAISFIPRSK